MSAHRTVATLFAERVQADAASTALIAEGRRLSYGELDEASNRFARHLRRHGATPETVVALNLDHGLATTVALVGVIKAGAAFLALTPSDPAARTAELLADARPVALVTDRPVPPELFAGPIVRIPEDLAAIGAEPSSPLPSLAHEHHLFHVVYTSGSTGRPKGVLVPMRALLNRLATMEARHPLQRDDVALLQRPLSIIGSSWDCFGPLLGGVPLVVVRDFDPGVPATWRAIAGHGVTHVAAAPAVWELLLEQCARRPGEWTTLRLAIVGGQAIDHAFVRRWTAQFPGGVLLNVYGATECVCPAAHPLKPSRTGEGRVAAGWAALNTDVHVLDDELRALPPGTIGEVCVGGDCLSRGYLNAPAMTAERFVPHPHSASPGRVLFRTGDLGFMAPDGLLHVVGRRDRQVKVNGFRDELGEGESALRRCERIAAAAAVATTGAAGDAHIVAYVVSADGAPVSTREVCTWLAAIVPRHLHPAAVVPLPEMPLTRSGKIDYQRLPRVAAASRTADAGPAGASALAVWLAGVWQEVLGAPVVPSDDFFDLGGDSLSAMRVAARVREAMGVDLDASQIFDAGTAAGLAEVVAAKSNAPAGAAAHP